MEIKKTAFDKLVIIVPRIFVDNRGYFYESYNQETYKNAGIPYIFVQDNQSESVKGVIRGLHYQLPPYAQTKLVRVISGTVLDVVVDLRKDSSTFGKWYGIELSDKNKLQLLVPQGFAHGFSVISDKAVLHYKTDNLYNKDSERGIVYNDTMLNIDWETDPETRIVSERDAQLPAFKDAEYNFKL
jgi:dTDP-4-dehydrorhamnose 3,5-epimerase